jgi:SEL1 protein
LQRGLGIPKDLHLAKRYYDMSLQADKDGYLAVNLALLHLGTDFVAEWYNTGTLSTVLPTEFWGLQWDTVLIIILVLILVVCVIIKQITRQP